MFVLRPAPHVTHRGSGSSISLRAIMLYSCQGEALLSYSGKDLLVEH